MPAELTTQPRNVIIVGSGPAGHTAAIYASRANLHPLLFEGFMASGIAAGGQLTTTTDVENYPGFSQGISGPQLMQEMRAQSLRFGTEIRTETIEKVDFKNLPFRCFPEDSEEMISSKTVIIATGASARRLHLSGEELYWQKGISACAVCDGALPLFRNKILAVIGGGDSACEEAQFLSKYGEKVLLIHRRDQLRASKVMQARIKNNPKIEIHWNSQALKVVGDGNVLTGMFIEDTQSGEKKTIEISGLFYAIGHTPNTKFLGGQIELDDSGYIRPQNQNCYTNIPGIFSAGDVMDKRYRQAVTAAGSGCMAALEVEKYLNQID